MAMEVVALLNIFTVHTQALTYSALGGVGVAHPYAIFLVGQLTGAGVGRRVVPVCA